MLNCGCKIPLSLQRQGAVVETYYGGRLPSAVAAVASAQRKWKRVFKHVSQCSRICVIQSSIIYSTKEMSDFRYEISRWPMSNNCAADFTLLWLYVMISNLACLSPICDEMTGQLSRDPIYKIFNFENGSPTTC